MTPKELKDSLTTVLAQYLGTYTLKDGSIIPAVSVGAKTPNVKSVSGLEVAIRKTPKYRNLIYQFGGTQADKTWRVVLKQWTSGAGLEAPLDAVIKAYPDAGSPVILEETDTTIEQATIEIPDQ